VSHYSQGSIRDKAAVEYRKILWITTHSRDIRETIAPGVVEIGQSLVIHAQEVKHGCVKVINAHAVFHGFVADFIRFAVQ